MWFCCCGCWSRFTERFCGSFRPPFRELKITFTINVQVYSPRNMRFLLSTHDKIHSVVFHLYSISLRFKITFNINNSRSYFIRAPYKSNCFVSPASYSNNWTTTSTLWRIQSNFVSLPLSIINRSSLKENVEYANQNTTLMRIINSCILMRNYCERRQQRGIADKDENFTISASDAPFTWLYSHFSSAQVVSIHPSCIIRSRSALLIKQATHLRRRLRYITEKRKLARVGDALKITNNGAEKQKVSPTILIKYKISFGICTVSN